MTPLRTLPVPSAPLAVLGFLRARILGVRAVSRQRKRIAFTVALCADLAQIVLWPAFAGGAASPFDDALDVAVAVVLSLTLGFSPRLALAFALELVPGADLFPTWTAVVASIPAHEEAAPPPSRA
jgi:hypothetical protein